MQNGCEIKIENPAEAVLRIHLIGNWRLGHQPPASDSVAQQAGSLAKVNRLEFKSDNLTAWDSSLLVWLYKIIKMCERRNIRVDKDGLPTGVKSLIDLAGAVPKKEDTRQTAPHEATLARIGSDFLTYIRSTGELLNFIGETFLAIVRLATGKAQFRAFDLGIFLQDSGARAVPIVSLISFLVGLILAFVGVIQLKIFGAQIFVADLVGIAMVRVMGAIMAGIVMAGRTGAAFAAQLGTMQVNEEIDALQTMGISPVEFLVLPRMIALTLMMPLLCLYSDLLGILGGWFVAVPIYGMNPVLYYTRTMEAVGLNHLFIGLFMSLVFGILVSLAGCLRGMQCGRSASAVGDATTSAVVTAIVAIIIATAVIVVACDILGI